MAFCVWPCFQVKRNTHLSYLDYLATHVVSVNMLVNHVSACREKFILNGLQFALRDQPNVHYLLKSIRINRPTAGAKLLGYMWVSRGSVLLQP